MNTPHERELSRLAAVAFVDVLVRVGPVHRNAGHSGEAPLAFWQGGSAFFGIWFNPVGHRNLVL
jgi:hypothetical protein